MENLCYQLNKWLILWAIIMAREEIELHKELKDVDLKKYI